MADRATYSAPQSQRLANLKHGDCQTMEAGIQTQLTFDLEERLTQNVSQ